MSWTKNFYCLFLVLFISIYVIHAKKYRDIIRANDCLIVQIEPCQTKKNADFAFQTFPSGENSFYNTRFSCLANFSTTKFTNIAGFSYSQFDSEVNFRIANFYSEADFEFTKFNSIADFGSSEFHSIANFDYARVDSEIIFDYCFFYKKLILTHLVTGNFSRFEFMRSNLPDSIDLSYNPYLFFKLPLAIDFTSCDFSKDIRIENDYKKWRRKISWLDKYLYPHDSILNSIPYHYINLYNTDISKVKIDYTHFKLYFKDIEDTSKQELSDDIKKSIYEQLLKNFKDRGEMESVEKLDIEYSWFKGREHTILTRTIDWWWRFGYEKWRIFIHSILFIFLFSIINFFILDKLNHKTKGVYRIENMPVFTSYKFGLSRKKYKNLISRFWYSLIYSSAIFFLLTLKIENIRFFKQGSFQNRFIHGILILWVAIIYLVGIVCMGFMANLILQK